MKTWLWFLVLVALGVAYVAVYLFWKQSRAKKEAEEQVKETFEGVDPDIYVTLEEKVVAIYKSTLQRMPNAQEMVDATRNLQDGTWTERGLKQRLIDSEEYLRLIKMQTNDLVPELQKIISDKDIINLVSKVYLEERKKEIPNYMVLPLRDAYILFDYNEYALRALLQHPHYPKLEEDVARDKNMDAVKFKALLEKHMGIEKIRTEGIRLAKEAKEAENKQKDGKYAHQFGIEWGNRIPGDAPEKSRLRTIQDRDGDLTPMIEDICQRADNIFCKDKAAQMLDRLHKETYQVPVRLHHGNMVLRPEMSWSVPQQAPPVCTTLGQKPLTQPVMTHSKLLLGTPLDEAADQKVGSIMPAFEYKEYVAMSCQDGESKTVNASSDT